MLVSVMVSLQWWLEDVCVAAESLLSNLPRLPPWPDPQVDLIHRTVGVDDLQGIQGSMILSTTNAVENFVKDTPPNRFAAQEM